jgi:hypothetical protein
MLRTLSLILLTYPIQLILLLMATAPYSNKRISCTLYIILALPDLRDMLIRSLNGFAPALPFKVSRKLSVENQETLIISAPGVSYAFTPTPTGLCIRRLK